MVGTRWRAKIGDHKGLEVTVVKVGATSVALRQTRNGRITVNGSSSRGAIMRLPIDAFFRRYERA
jgi:hypothetical protein